METTPDLDYAASDNLLKCHKKCGPEKKQKPDNKINLKYTYEKIITHVVVG